MSINDDDEIKGALKDDGFTLSAVFEYDEYTEKLLREFLDTLGEPTD